MQFHGLVIPTPADIEVGGSTSLDRIKGLLMQGLLRRISGASRVLPLLRPGACVVLASGDGHPPVDAPDDRGARRRLLNVIADSIIADTAGSNIGAFVVDEDWSADAIVKLVCHHTLVAGAREGDLEGAEPASGTSPGSLISTFPIDGFELPRIASSCGSASAALPRRVRPANHASELRGHLNVPEDPGAERSRYL